MNMQTLDIQDIGLVSIQLYGYISARQTVLLEQES